MKTPVAELNLAYRIRRRIVPAPVLVFFHTLFVKGLIFDGWPGWLYVTQRTLAEFLLSLRLLEAKVAGKSLAGRRAAKEIENGETTEGRLVSNEFSAVESPIHLVGASHVGSHCRSKQGGLR